MTKISAKARRQARWDKQQYVLDYKSETATTKRITPITTIVEETKTVYYCPFCLFFGSISKFKFRTPKGKESKKARCPECKNEMLMRTITVSMTPEQYAEWVYAYVKDGFWQKIKFEKWKERLYKLGMAQRFWAKYRLLKGSSEETETYQEYVERKAKEEAEEMGVIG